jgi:hypothetical protein
MSKPGRKVIDLNFKKEENRKSRTESVLLEVKKFNR